MTEWSVPVRSSGWRGTGTVTLPRSVYFCMTTWLPRWRASAKAVAGEDGADLPPREPTQPPQR